MHEQLKGDIRTYWKTHAAATVKEAFAKYGRLVDCVVVLAPGEGAPRLVKRAEAHERLEKRGLDPYILDLIEEDDPDSLGLVWKEGHETLTESLVVARGEEPSEPPESLPIPPFTRPFKMDDAWIDGVGTMIEGLQQQAYDHVRGIGDVPNAYMLFWRLFEGSPTMIVREGAKAALGKHKKWREILGHVYTPCEDVMALVEISGRELVRFVRAGKR
jgi:hypothetical protein